MVGAAGGAESAVADRMAGQRNTLRRIRGPLLQTLRSDLQVLRGCRIENGLRPSVAIPVRGSQPFPKARAVRAADHATANQKDHPRPCLEPGLQDILVVPQSG